MKSLLIALISCAAVGVVGAIEPRTFVIVPTLAAVALIAVLAYRRPRAALTLAMLFVLMAATKVRNRDPAASLLHPVDNQIIVEVGLYALMALITVVAALSPSFKARRLVAQEWMLVAFVLLALTSTLWSDAPLLTLVRAVQLAALLVLGLVAVRVLDGGGTIHALGAAIVGYVLTCAAITVVFPSTRVTSSYLGDTVALAEERFSWFALHSISAATFAAIAILYVLCVVLFLPGGWRHGRAKILLLPTLLPLGVILVATESRGPLFALVGAIGALVGLRVFRPVVSLALAALAAGGVLAAALAGLTPTSVLEDTARSNVALSAVVLRGQNVKQFSTLTGRTELWSAIIPLYLERPIIGRGYLGSREALLKVAPWAGHAHNGFLQSLLDLGIVGALLLWTPFFWTLLTRPPEAKSAHVDRWVSAAVFAALVLTLLNSLSDVAIAGSPGYEILLFLCCVIAAAHGARGPVHAVSWADRKETTTWARRATTSTA